MPTFRWRETPSGDALDSTREGNGLRVWLERPWFSSGTGELLGVVILGDNRPFTEINNKLVPLVTQWGLDPLWDTALPKHRTRVSDFPTHVAAELVHLRELEAEQVHVVGHRVHWDSVRGLWYCDIELDPGHSYMPFVRLALVRYQPNALASAKISNVVLADFAQVLPRRRASFRRHGTPLEFGLYGIVPDRGPMAFPLDSVYQDISFSAGMGQAVETGRNKVELVLQAQEPALDSDLAWSDVRVLSSNLVGPVAGGIIGGAATTGDHLKRRIDLGTAVDLGSISALDATTAVGVGGQEEVIADPIESALFQSSVTLPDTGGKPARVVAREYERYYTDRTVPEDRAGATRRRRVVEERLVYTAFFGL